jgi:5'-3' exonuclease
MSRILIIDQNNLFLRSYIVDPSVSLNGAPIGGVFGMLKSLQKFIVEIKPTRIITCWDGAGGSKKRREINKSYKSGRKPIRLNRTFDMTLNEHDELENKIWQMTRLSQYYDVMPVTQFLVDNVEADDIIAYTHSLFPEDQKVILSSDKDFIQLLDKKTLLYRPVQKEIMTGKSVSKCYGIATCNFALARSMAGDPSDSLKGVDGVGLKTVAKRFPFLQEEKSYTISELLSFCKKTLNEEKKPSKIFENILQQQEKIKENYKIMQLAAPNISAQSKKLIKDSIRDFIPMFNKTEFRKMMVQDGFSSWNWDNLFMAFGGMCNPKE